MELPMGKSNWLGSIHKDKFIFEVHVTCEAGVQAWNIPLSIERFAKKLTSQRSLARHLCQCYRHEAPEKMGLAM